MWGGGTNDFINNVPLEKFEYNIYQLINILHNKTDQKIIFITPACFKTGDKGMDYADNNGNRVNWPNYTGHTLDEYVDVIIAACDKNGITVLDLYHDEIMDSVVNPAFYYDTIHPNKQGHAYIAQRLIQIMRNS